MEAEQADILISSSPGNKGTAQLPSLSTSFSTPVDHIWPQKLLFDLSGSCFCLQQFVFATVHVSREGKKKSAALHGST